MRRDLCLITDVLRIMFSTLNYVHNGQLDSGIAGCFKSR